MNPSIVIIDFSNLLLLKKNSEYANLNGCKIYIITFINYVSNTGMKIQTIPMYICMYFCSVSFGKVTINITLQKWITNKEIWLYLAAKLRKKILNNIITRDYYWLIVLFWSSIQTHLYKYSTNAQAKKILKI